MHSRKRLSIFGSLYAGTSWNGCRMSDLTLTVRPLGRARGEHEFVKETCLKVPQPYVQVTTEVRASAMPWRTLLETRGPALEELMETGTCYIGESGGVLLGFALWRKDGALSMLYVKQQFRGNKFGLQLLPKIVPDSDPIRFVCGGIKAIDPTPCWRRWSEHWGLPWEAVR